MRKITVLCALLLTTVFLANAQDKKSGPPKSPRVTAQNDIAEISYGQPSKRGRVIFGDLVPYGKIWRTGANKSTDLTVKTDVLFAGKPLKKGTYAVFTIPGEKEWTIILNSKTKQNGAFDYEKNKDKNVLEVTAKVNNVSDVLEKFTISFENDNMVFGWDKVRVPVSLKKQ